MSDWFSPRSPLIIAHRGASADAPENSLAAFSLAVDQGADGIELDVQLSSDGWPIIMHDRTVNRTTGGSGAVSKLTMRQLQDLDAGDGRPVPTLDQVFEMFGPAILYNIELKDRGWFDRRLAVTVANRVEAHHMTDHVLVSSFNPLVLRRGRRHLSERTPTAFIRMTAWSRHGARLAGGQADHPYDRLVDETYLAWAKRRGYRVHVWTVDDPARARRLVELGVHGIITNKPGLMRHSLDNLT